MFLRSALDTFFASRNESDSPAYSQEQVAAAKVAAYAASPHTYEIILANPDKKVSFLVFGCQGNAKEAQKRVAILMDQMVKISQPAKSSPTAASAAIDDHSLPAINIVHEEDHTVTQHNTHEPAVILCCLVIGDNFYDRGVPKPDDPAFFSHFYDIYVNNRMVPSLAQLPFFALQGNHDQGRWKTGEFAEQLKYEIGLPSTGLKGVDLGMNQVAHSYLGNTHDRQALYNQSRLNLSNLPAWNMPSRYYSLIIGKMQIFMIDSNTYASDYLQLISGINVAPDNQARWLKEQVTAAKAAGREVMLALHHPLFTPGKRAYNSDITLYLTSKEIEEAKIQFKETFVGPKPPYNTLLWDIFKRQELLFKTVFAAHDHSLSYFNNLENCANPRDGLCQIISAGAGGGLQQRLNFNQQENMGGFLKKHGVVQVTFDPANTNNVQFDIVGINDNGDIDNHMIFSSAHCKPVRHFPTMRSEGEITEIITFFAIVKSAVDEYCKFLGNRQDNHDGSFFHRNITHGDEGIDSVHELWAYISDSRTCRYDLARIVADVHEITSWHSMVSVPAKHSLITILDNKLFTRYRTTLEGLHQQCKLFKNRR